MSKKGGAQTRPDAYIPVFESDTPPEGAERHVLVRVRARAGAGTCGCGHVRVREPSLLVRVLVRASTYRLAC